MAEQLSMFSIYPFLPCGTKILTKIIVAKIDVYKRYSAEILVRTKKFLSLSADFF